jgi:hypothetical protein
MKASMKLKVETIKVADLKPYPSNPRKGDVNLIAESLKVNGQYKPILVQAGTNVIVAGNHTWQAAKKLGWETVEIVRLDVDDKAAKRIMLSDNRTNDVAIYDYETLQQILNDLDGDLEGTGYSLNDLDGVIESAVRELDEATTNESGEKVRNESEDRSTTLLVASLDAGMPNNETESGDVWQVGNHTLIVCEPHTEWAQFVPYLTEGKILAIYPDVFITASERAKTNELVLVQPRTYLAGHILDKHKSMFPNETIKKLK